MFSSAATSGWKAGVASALATMALVALAYRFPAVVEVDFGRSFASALASEGLYESEGSYRWSRGRGEILFPDPGARDPVRVELVLSGFRPKDTPQPIVVFEAGSETSRQLASRRIASYSLDTATTGVWSSTLRIQLRSDTFVPGQGDERALGVRLHRARLVLAGPASPPLKQLLASGALALLLFASLGFAGLSVRRGFSVALGFGLVLGIGFAFFRFHAALFTPAATLFLSAVFAGRSIFPSLTSFIGDSGKSAARALLEGTLTLRTPLALGAALLALLATFAGYAAAPKVELRLGSGEADPIARRFAGFDRDLDGTAFRRAFPGATLDLRDFGARRPWTVAIRAALEDEVDAPVRGVLAQAGEASLEADLGSGWSTHRFELDPPPWSWRSGHVLQFPGFGQGRKIRLASVEIDRGRSTPSFRAIALVLGSQVLFVAGLGACGLPRRPSVGVGTLLAGLIVLGIGLAPVLVIPLMSRILLAAASAFLLAAVTRGALSALSQRDLAPEISPGALALAAAAFALWFLTTASPLYSGGHFGYHTSVAEEISQGKFLLYYFPGPDNMLSRQPQWGDLTVPHPSLFHTLTAPLALLPREWFHLTTKLFLALLLFGSTLVAALVATSAGDSRTGLYAVLTMAALPTGPQLLGLGHLMTILGVWAAAAALGFVAVQETRLERRREWLLALALLSLAFLSYTGTLLFGSASLAAAALFLYRDERRLSKRLALLLVAGWVAALLLYYVHWVPAFFQQTLPAMLTGTGSDRSIDLGSRLRLAPGKLDYTFGAWIVPLLGLAGLSLARSPARRTLLYCWAMVLVFFSGLDLVFNFLLKHHYFSLPAVAVGIGLASSWVERKKAWGMAVLLLFFVFLWLMGLREMIAVARGRA